MSDEVTLRDTFAAAALTGLLYRPAWFPHECAPEAFRLADAMLRERATTIHDAAPAARASEATASPERVRVRGDAGTGDTDHGASPEARASVGRPRTDKADLPNLHGTGDTTGPLAWAAIRENGQPLWLSYDRFGAEGMVNGMAEVIPLYRSPTLTDAEREAIEWLTAGESPFADEEARLRVLRGLSERLGGGR
jgi:hypothetical protein